MEHVSLFCPQCGVERVLFAGLLARVDVRSNTELVAPFTCGNSHVFFVLLKDVAEALQQIDYSQGEAQHAKGREREPVRRVNLWPLPAEAPQQPL
jgi:hypothetical protein